MKQPGTGEGSALGSDGNARMDLVPVPDIARVVPFPSVSRRCSETGGSEKH